jgi:hypothetical protein
MALEQKPKNAKSKKKEVILIPRPNADDLAQLFINIYFTSLVKKDKNILETLLREPKSGNIYTKINFMQNKISGIDINNYFSNILEQDIDFDINNEKILTIPKGERYLSILVIGKMNINNEIKDFVKHFNIEALWNNKEGTCNFWIESIMHDFI